MSSTENPLPDLMPAALSLCRADKLRLIQALVSDLAREEGVTLLEARASYPVWTPIHAFDAAATLLRELGSQEAAP